ncbi:shikimate kinase [Virgibacillus senegalensis]|uniref:shikimate kinase n=1 Tax=Virgibacillus senegalensis TaxID=1499679 RepID=UPI00069ED7E1|nr:shikimate kinase [Virgibacillus senegalensis]
MKAVYLIGFMGSGKTSISQLLAEKLMVQGLDTDREIEQKARQTIPEIFEQQGEAAFREQETAILTNMPVSDAVIATGGGIVESSWNRNWLKENVYVVYLHASFEEIDRRLGVDPSRPLWNKHDKSALYEHRLEKYRQTAHSIVKTDGKSPEQVAEEIYQLIINNKTVMLGI